MGSGDNSYLPALYRGYEILVKRAYDPKRQGSERDEARERAKDVFGLVERTYGGFGDTNRFANSKYLPGMVPSEDEILGEMEKTIKEIERVSKPNETEGHADQSLLGLF